MSARRAERSGKCASGCLGGVGCGCTRGDCPSEFKNLPIMSVQGVIALRSWGWGCTIDDGRPPPHGVSACGYMIRDGRVRPMPVDCVVKLSYHGVMATPKGCFLWAACLAGGGVLGGVGAYLLTFQSLLFFLPSYLLLASCVSLLFSLVPLIEGIVLVVKG